MATELTVLCNNHKVSWDTISDSKLTVCQIFVTKVPVCVQKWQTCCRPRDSDVLHNVGTPSNISQYWLVLAVVLCRPEIWNCYLEKSLIIFFCHLNSKLKLKSWRGRLIFSFLVKLLLLLYLLSSVSFDSFNSFSNDSLWELNSLWKCKW